MNYAQFPSCMVIDGWLKFLTTRLGSRLRGLKLVPQRWCREENEEENGSDLLSIQRCIKSIVSMVQYN